MSRPDYLLFDRNTTALIYGMQTKARQRMLDLTTAVAEKPRLLPWLTRAKAALRKFSGAKKKFLFRFTPMLNRPCRSTPISM